MARTLLSALNPAPAPPNFGPLSDTLHLHLTGGEPLARPDLVELIFDALEIGLLD